MLPPALLAGLEGLPGYDEAAFLRAHRLPAPVSVRLHPLRGTSLFANCPAVPWEPLGRYLAVRPAFARDPLWHAGAYYVQEASSMLAGWAARHLFPEPAGLRVLDLCAAPGGKSTHLAGWLPPDALLVSNEVIRSRAAILAENAQRWGYPHHWVSANDPAAFAGLPAFFDLVVADVPCSGSGLFRKDPDALDHWSTDAVALCAARQERILHDVWPALKPGGVLLYATCSYSPAEDEHLLARFRKDTGAVPLPLPVPEAWGVVPAAGPEGSGWRCFPHRVGGEGFFLAALQKPAGPATPRAEKPGRSRSRHDARMWQQARHLLQPGDWALLPFEKAFLALPAALEADYHLLRQRLYLRSAGIFLGAPAGGEWIPEHALALSVAAAPDLPRQELNREQALRYLRKEDPGLENAPPGWLLATYEGRALGWMKALKGRVNNYLPKHLRLRKAE